MKDNSQIPGETHVTPSAEGLSKIIHHFGASRLRLPSWKAPRAAYAVLMITSRWLHCKGQISCFELCFSEVSIQLRYSVPQEFIPSAAYRLHWKCSLVLVRRADTFFVSTDLRELSDFFNSEGELTCKPQRGAFFEWMLHGLNQTLGLSITSSIVAICS